MKGLVEKVEKIGTSKKGNPYFRVIIDGKESLTFDGRIMNYLNKTIEAKVEKVVKNGKTYWNLIDFKEVKDFTPEYIKDLQKEDKNRAFALAYAKDIAVALIQQGENDINTIKEITIDIADRFYGWLVKQTELDDDDIPF